MEEKKVLKQDLLLRVQELLKDKKTTENPVVKATHLWTQVAGQIENVVGHSVYNQWFKKVVPLVIADNLLILKSPSTFETYWLKKHYQDLVDVLLSFQDKEIRSFFVCPLDINQELKETTSEIES